LLILVEFDLNFVLLGRRRHSYGTATATATTAGSDYIILILKVLFCIKSLVVSQMPQKIQKKLMDCQSVFFAHFARHSRFCLLCF
jgi:hypothetical protein